MSEKDANLSKKFMDQIMPKTPFKKNKINGVKKIIVINLVIVFKNLKYNVSILDNEYLGIV